MPVALKTPASPMPASIAGAAAPGAAATPATAAGSFNFLALLANMNTLAASVLPGETPAAPDTTASAELAQLIETDGQDTDSDTDAPTDEDDELMAALALAGLPVPVPQTPVPQPVAITEDVAKAGSPILDTLSDQIGSAAAPTPEANGEDFAARIAPQAATQNLLPIAVPTDAAATLAKADADAEAAASTAGTSSSSSSSSSNVPSHLQMMAHAQASAEAPRELRAPVGTHAWTRQLSDELAWMMQQGKDSASLKLSPEHLGPLEVRISMREGEASVWFGATQSDTRNALEQALPRLREMFASQGLALADAGVFKEAPRQQGRMPGGNSTGNGIDAATEITPSSRTSLVSARLLDTYA